MAVYASAMAYAGVSTQEALVDVEHPLVSLCNPSVYSPVNNPQTDVYDPGRSCCSNPMRRQHRAMAFPEARPACSSEGSRPSDLSSRRNAYTDV